MTTTPTTSTGTNSILQNYLNTQQAAINAAGASSAATSSSTSSQGVFNNESTFLNILTTQLQNQDPTATTDTNAFTEELVQFAQVEQQLNTNSDLAQLIALQKNTGTGALVNYMGQYIEAPTTTGQMALQGGTSEIGFTLPSASSSVTIAVTDASGNAVTSFTGPTTQGLNYVTWNGMNSSGTQMPDGAYTFAITATDESGNAETITDMRVLGKVTGITTGTGGTVNLALGNGTNVGVTTVDAVFGTSASNLPTTTSTGSSSTPSSS